MRITGFAPSMIVASATMLSGASQAQTVSAYEEYQRGEGLFTGRIELQGRISSHLADLPAEVVRCANCHAVAHGPDVQRSLAPRLTHELLLEKRSRRGGPTSAYDGGTFCELLTKGVDPAYVVISIEMPRYRLEPGACQALWRFLTWAPGEPGAH